MKIPREDKALTHKPGMVVVIPKTLWTLCAYPAKLVFKSLDGKNVKEITLPLTGPVKDFTVETDYKRNKVSIFGKANEGYYRLRISLEGKELLLCKEKASFPLEEKSVIAIAKEQSSCEERLYLGSNKTRFFERVRERSSLEEILPLWHALGKNAPKVDKEKGAVLDLFSECEKKPSKELFLLLYKAAFSEGFVPRGKDEEYQGILSGEDSLASYLLFFGAAFIRSLFFQEGKDGYVLPGTLFKDLPCGKMEGIKTTRGDLLSFTWSKGKLFTMTVRPSKAHEVAFFLPKELRSFRVKSSSRDKGRKVLADEPLMLEPGKELTFDRFEK